jgi:hypothetical protein
MDLVFATVLSCDETGCTVRFLDGETPVWTPYSAEVREHIRIRRRELVAVDRAAEPPQIVWRWIRAEVLELRGEGAVVGAHGLCAEMTPRNPDLPLHKGDRVWIGGYGGVKYIEDRVHGDGAVHPDELAAHAFPLIAAWYEKARTPAAG